MKTLIAAAVVILTASAAFGQTYTAPVVTRKAPQARQRPAPPITPGQVGGVIPRALRGGNPLQMLNPRAPARYGTAEQSVTFHPDVPGKWNGIKLFAITF